MQSPAHDAVQDILEDGSKCHVRETWIIMEYCDRVSLIAGIALPWASPHHKSLWLRAQGNLQEAVDKGVFNMRKASANKELQAGKPNMLMIRRAPDKPSSARLYRVRMRKPGLPG